MTRVSMRRTAAIAALTAALAVGSLDALYRQPELRLVPVERLAANLEAQLAAGPPTADLHIRLARVYGMAYAGNTDELPVARPLGGEPKEPEEVWTGHEPRLVPQPPGRRGQSRQEASAAYLKQAGTHYDAALALEPGSLLARLGRGWVRERAGDKPGAIADYRQVIEQAWPKEQNKRLAGLGERFFTQEAAGYLIPLLDPIKDEAEIATLRERTAKMARIPRPVTPIAIPLDDRATPADIVDLDARVLFDADGSGARRQWTWITPKAGWLVYDAAGRGAITSALQWFGSVTFWNFWQDGYQALAALDDNRDGALTGHELRYLAVWVDRNGNGTSDRGEVQPLAAHDITWLSCRGEAGDRRLVAAQAAAGVRFGSGRVRPTYDVILRPSASVSVP